MLLNLINDLLDLAKVENNTFTIVESFFDLNHLIEKAFDTVRCVADQKNISLEFDQSSKLPNNLTSIEGFEDHAENIFA